jgi:hypothetical protein
MISKVSRFYCNGHQYQRKNRDPSSILSIFRPTARIGIRIRLRTPTPTRTTSSAPARRPRPRRRELPTRSRSTSSSRAHRRRPRTRRAVFRIQQTLKEVLQHLMLRRARRAAECRRRRCARASPETAERGATAALHLR